VSSTVGDFGEPSEQRTAGFSDAEREVAPNERRDQEPREVQHQGHLSWWLRLGIHRLFLKSSLPLPGNGYTLAVILVALTLAMRFVIHSGVDIPLVVVFVPAILVVSSAAGFWPGTFATLLSCACINYFLVPGDLFKKASIERLEDLSSFAITGLLIAGVCELLRTAFQQSEAAKAGLAQALAAAERLSAIIEGTGDAVVGKSTDGVIVSWNNACEALFGYSTAEAIGMHVRELIPPQLRAEEETQRRQAIAGRTTRSFETLRRRKDGSAFDVSITISPIVDARGSVTGVSSIIHDLSEHRKLEEQTAFLAAIVRCSDEGFVGFSPDGTIQSWNEAAERIYGYSAAEVVGTRMYDRAIVPSDADFQEETRRLKGALRGEPVEAFDTVRVRKDGSRVDVEIAISPVRDQLGNFVGVSSIVRDISKRKAYEQQQALLSSVVEGSIDAIYTKTLDGIITSCNGPAEEMFGYRAAELIGKSMTLLFPPEQLAEEAMLLAKIRAGEAVKPYETHRVRKDSTRMNALVSLSPIRDNSGRVIGVSKVLRDISQRKRMEETLKRQAELLRCSFDAIIVWHLDGAIESWNNGAEKLYGYSEVEAAGRVTHDLLSTVFPKSWVEIRSELIENGSWEGELHHRTRDGRWVVVSNRLQLIRGEDGSVRVLETNRDITEKKATEEALRVSLERLQKVLDIQTVGVMFWDLKTGAMVETNDTFLKLTGYSRDEVRRGELTWQKLTPAEYMEASLAEVQEVLTTGKAGPYEKEYFCKDGSRKWFLFAGSSLGNNQCVEFCVDISARKHAEVALRDSEERLNFALHSARMAAWDYDYTTETAHWSPQMYSLLGLSHGAGAEHSSRFFDRVHPDDVTGLKAAMANIVGSEWFYEFRIVDQNSAVRWLVSQGRLIRDAKGHPATLSGICYDITERKQAEALIRAGRAKLASALGSMTDGVFICDNDGNFTHFNEAFAKFLRFPSIDVCLRSLKDYPAVFEVFTPNGELVPFDHWPVNRALNGETASGLEFHLRRKDTGESWLGSYNFGPIRDTNGEILGAVMTMRDITEQKASDARMQELRNQLSHAGRINAMGQVSAGLAHELNQPLAAIANYASLMKRLTTNAESQVGAKVHEVAVKVAEQALRAGLVIRRMRGFVEQHEFERSAEDIDAIIEDSLMLGLIGAKAANIHTYVELPSDLPPVRVDRVHIQQVLVNLVRNAAEAMADAPRRDLTISARLLNEAVEVAVADTGPGIPARIADRLFQPFVTTKSGGMGVGLSISRSLIEAHKGQLTASENEGGGTVFRFTLPIAKDDVLMQETGTRHTSGRSDTAEEHATSEGSKPLVAWRDELVVGVRSIDDQHQQLVELVNRVDFYLREGADEHKVASAFTELAEYTAMHFRYEEELMQRVPYQDAERHTRRHRQLIGLLDTYQQALSTEFSPRAITAQLRGLRTWLVQHIQDQDVELGNSLNRGGIQ
jgi:PAS domain S-box/hemerythrin-like metal-binding domain